MKYIVYDTEDEMIFDKVENYILKPGDRILGEFDTPEQAAKILMTMVFGLNLIWLSPL